MDESARRAQPDTPRSKRSPRMRSVLAATGLVVVALSPFAVAKTGDVLREGKRNGTTTKETEIVSNIRSSSKSKGGYSTRQSNVSKSGGGAIYGCRASSAASSEACVRASNLSTGRAFEFSAKSGLVGGIITMGTGGDSKKPFTTNATGVATGLNADRVDGKSAADLETRWVLIGLNGAIEAQSGGFTVVTAYPAAPSPARHNVYINAGEDLSDNGMAATIALQNQVDQGGNATNNGTNAGPDANPEFSGEISAAKCLTPGLVACAPPGTASSNVLVVSPRNSDGSGTVPGERKRFYVSITG